MQGGDGPEGRTSKARSSRGRSGQRRPGGPDMRELTGWPSDGERCPVFTGRPWVAFGLTGLLACLPLRDSAGLSPDFPNTRSGQSSREKVRWSLVPQAGAPPEVWSVTTLCRERLTGMPGLGSRSPRSTPPRGQSGLRVMTPCEARRVSSTACVGRGDGLEHGHSNGDDRLPGQACAANTPPGPLRGRGRQRNCLPPSTISVCPVTKALPGEARKRAAPTTSPGCWARRMAPRSTP